MCLLTHHPLCSKDWTQNNSLEDSICCNHLSKRQLFISSCRYISICVLLTFKLLSNETKMRMVLSLMDNLKAHSSPFLSSPLLPSPLSWRLYLSEEGHFYTVLIQKFSNWHKALLTHCSHFTGQMWMWVPECLMALACALDFMCSYSPKATREGKWVLEILIFFFTNQNTAFEVSLWGWEYFEVGRQEVMCHFKTLRFCH
jgi:hypothetical protein